MSTRVCSTAVQRHGLHGLYETLDFRIAFGLLSPTDARAVKFTVGMEQVRAPRGGARQFDACVDGLAAAVREERNVERRPRETGTYLGK